MTAPGGLRPVRAWACLGLLLGAPLPLLLRAAEPPPKAVEPADADLIEFLGSVDSDDAGWKQYSGEYRCAGRTSGGRLPPPTPACGAAAQ